MEGLARVKLDLFVVAQKTKRESYLYLVRKCARAAIPRRICTSYQPQAANTTEDYLAQSFSNPYNLIYPLNLQRSDSQLGYLRYNVHQVHRRHNLPNSTCHRVPDVVPAARLKHVHVIVGLSAAAHDRLWRFQAVVFSHIVPPSDCS